MWSTIRNKAICLWYTHIFHACFMRSVSKQSNSKGKEKTRETEVMSVTPPDPSLPRFFASPLSAEQWSWCQRFIVFTSISHSALDQDMWLNDLSIKISIQAMHLRTSVIWLTTSNKVRKQRAPSLKSVLYQSTKHKAQLKPSAKLYYVRPFTGLLSSFFVLIESEISVQASWQVATDWEPNKGL